MKKVMFALCFMLGGVVTLVAQDTQDTTSNQYRTETQSQYPQAQYPQDAQAQQGQNQDRERIQTTELPDEVKRALEGPEYRGWLISGAFKSTSDQSSMQSQNGTDATSPDNTNSDAGQQSANATSGQEEEVYVVELKNGAETKTLRFDKDGQKLEDAEGMSGQNSQFNENSQNQNSEGQSGQSQSGQTGQSSQYNQNDQSETDGQTDASSTTDQTESTDYNRSTETRTGEDAQSTDTQSTDTQSSDQSTGTQSSQSGQTDQSRANEPK